MSRDFEVCFWLRAPAVLRTAQRVFDVALRHRRLARLLWLGQVRWPSARRPVRSLCRRRPCRRSASPPGRFARANSAGATSRSSCVRGASVSALGAPSGAQREMVSSASRLSSDTSTSSPRPQVATSAITRASSPTTGSPIGSARACSMRKPTPSRSSLVLAQCESRRAG
jgi:hypothetical protein